MRPTRPASVSRLVRAITGGVVLAAAGVVVAYQDGRLDGLTPSVAKTEGVAQEEGVAPQDSGRDPARLDLQLPDLRVRPPSGMHIVDERSEGGPVRLKFTTLIWNASAGPLEVRGDPDDAEGGLEVEQYAIDAQGTWHALGAVGRFDFEHRHGHLHLEGFADYELWSLPNGPTGQPGERIAENVKIGFCLMDNVVVDETLAVGEAAYLGCEAEVQGISPGYGDLYVAKLYEQDIDITDVPDGRYRLVNIANPDGVLHEADPANNAAHADVELRTAADGQRVVASVP